MQEKSKIAVYDLGGGTFDLSILELTGGVFQVLSTNGNTRLGGDDLDKRLIDFIVDSSGPPAARTSPPICPSSPASARPPSRPKSASPRGELPTSPCPFLTPDFHFDYTLTRAELEDLTRDIIQRTRPHCLRSLADAKLEPRDLDQVILVGGQTRMPLVRRIVAGDFWLRGI